MGFSLLCCGCGATVPERDRAHDATAHPEAVNAPQDAHSKGGE